MWYAKARYYDSDLGRFVAEDPLKGNIADIQSQNLYPYVRNNPLKYVDLDGREAKKPDYIGLAIEGINLNPLKGGLVASLDNNLVNYKFDINDINIDIEDIPDNEIDNTIKKLENILFLLDHFSYLFENISPSFIARIKGYIEKFENEGKSEVATSMSLEGANLLAQMEVNQNSKYMVKEDGVVKGIITHDVGDGGLTVGYGYYIKGGLGNTEEIKRLKDEYGIIVEEGKMVEIDKVTKLYSDSLGTYESLAQDYINSRGLEPSQNQFDALVIQCYNGAHYSVMDAFGDSNLNDAQALDKALETYKNFSKWNNFGDGWTNRLENVINLYRHGDYTKTY